jgi:hypothetical protein
VFNQFIPALQPMVAKAVCLTHRFWWSLTMSILDNAQLIAGIALLNVLVVATLFPSADLTFQIAAGLGAGAAAIVLARAIRSIRKHGD